MEKHEVAEFVDGLRSLADFLEYHSDNLGELYGARCNPIIYVYSEQEMVAERRKLRGHGGVWHKVVDDFEFSLVKQFSPTVDFKIHGTRQTVCEAIVVGTETVEVPDYENRPPIPTKTVERPIIEYRCPPSLGGSHPTVVGE